MRSFYKKVVDLSFTLEYIVVLYLVLDFNEWLLDMNLELSDYILESLDINLELSDYNLESLDMNLELSDVNSVMLFVDLEAK